MNFLDLPNHYPLQTRSNSQIEFVEAAENEAEMEREEESTSEYNFQTLSIDRNAITRVCDENFDGGEKASVPLKIKYTLGFLSVLCVLLAGGLTTFIFLYLNTFPPYEICRTKLCTRTATIFTKTIDENMDPCEDFHKFACGNWITDTATVVSVGVYDHTTIMRDRIIGRLRGITQGVSAKKDIRALQLMKVLYLTCVDLDRNDRAGLAPLITLLEDMLLTQHGTLEDSIAKTLGKIRRETSQSYLFDFSLWPDYQNGQKYAIFVDEPELPVDKEIFISPETEDLISAYRILIIKALGYLSKENMSPSLYNLLFARDFNQTAQIVIEIENNIAMAITGRENFSKPQLFNLLNLRELNRLFRGENEFGPIKGLPLKMDGIINPQYFDWIEYLQVLYKDFPLNGQVKIDEDFSLIVNDLKFIRKLAKILLTTKDEHIRVYLAWQVIFSFGKNLTRGFKALFSQFSSLIDGNESTPNRHTVCTELLDKVMPFAISHKYVLKYVKPSLVPEVKEMVNYIVGAFKETVSGLDWMDENTRERAKKKADKIRAFLGYPQWILDPDSVNDFHKGLNFTLNFFTNMRRVLRWRSSKTLGKLFQNVDKFWSGDDSPSEANAFYDDELNAITFPSGFLQIPFVGMGLSAIDFGALGSVIGHELSHGFDTRGRYSDEKGRLNSWWSIDTLQKFLKKAKCFEDQYSTFDFPELKKQLGDNNKINGKKTLEENIGDNGGIRQSFRAYQNLIKQRGRPEPRLLGLEKYNPEQLFFLSFAQSWCSYTSLESLLALVQSNVHSPPRYRILGPLLNFNEFAKVWNCKKNSFMNIENKCVLW